MKLIKLEDMSIVDAVTEQEPICVHKDCGHRGDYSECYYHTHVWCEEFDKWYSHKYQVPKDI